MIHLSFIAVAHAAGVITDAKPISGILENVLNFLLSVVGVVAIIGLVVGSVIYLTAGGDEDRIRLAKMSLTASVVGLVLALGALVIVTQLGSLFS